MYKQWMTKQHVSASDILNYFNNPKNNLEIQQELIKLLSIDKRLMLKTKLFLFWHEKILHEYIDTR